MVPAASAACNRGIVASTSSNDRGGVWALASHTVAPTRNTNAKAIALSIGLTTSLRDEHQTDDQVPAHTQASTFSLAVRCANCTAPPKTGSELATGSDVPHPCRQGRQPARLLIGVNPPGPRIDGRADCDPERMPSVHRSIRGPVDLKERSNLTLPVTISGTATRSPRQQGQAHSLWPPSCL
jgi:hypothetical protein